MAKNFSETWQELQSSLLAAGGALLGACDQSFERLEELRTELATTFRDAEPPSPTPDRIESLGALYADAAQPLLHQPLSTHHSIQAQAKVAQAFETYVVAIEELIVGSPIEVSASETELVENLGRRAADSWITKSFRKPEARRVPVRATLSRALHRRRTQLLRRIGEVLLRFAQLEEALTDPWDATLEEGLRGLDGSGADPKEFHHDRRRWLSLGERRRAEASAALAALRESLESIPGQAAAELARARPARTAAAPSRLSARLKTAFGGWRRSPVDKTAECLAFWKRRREGIAAQFDLSIRQARLGEECTAVSRATLDSLGAERSAALAELDAVAEKLRAWDGTLDGILDDGFLPPSVASPEPAADRIRDWSTQTRRAASLLLPDELELSDPRGVLSPWPPPWRRVRPLGAFNDALESQASHLGGLLQAEDSHRSVVSDIDRARQVVLYGLESAAEENEPGMAREAVDNALNLIERRRARMDDSLVPAEASLTEASAAILSRCSAAVAEGRFGLLRRLARQRGPRFAKQSGAQLIGWLQQAFLWAWKALDKFNRWLLIRIGWERAPETLLQPVERRPQFVDRAPSQLVAAELPLIYGRLFRPEPVGDPRFLIGRREEMDALLECRRSWEADLPTALLIVGERGSGKTSLINCAKASVFQSFPVSAGAFDARIVDAEGMDKFLLGMFGLDETEDLVEALRRERRVAILEELERTFLRRIGGFKGLERLLSVVAKTKDSVLWCLAVNQAGFKLADAAVGMHRVFSHRINARAVSAKHLRRAILQRHDLSGMRLNFRRTSSNSPLHRLRGALGFERSPREEFFDTLYDQSRGVFRSAFQLWRSAMTVSGDSIRLQTPSEPDVASLNASLDLHDLFTLQAVLQHGALTGAEHAAVFAAAAEESADRLNRLREMGMLEVEDDCGLRVRPEAAHLVRSLLDSNNLL